MAKHEEQASQTNSHEGEEVTVTKTSGSVGSIDDKKTGEPVTNMPMNHKYDMFVDWDMAIRG